MLDLTPGEWAGGGAIIVFLVTTLIQISPIKINPWTALARAIGRAINGEVIEKVNRLESEVRTMRDTNEELNIEERRVRILRFGDEILHDVRHSKEHFDNILKDISVYEQYCDDHPNFENGRTVMTIKIINETYKKCFINHTFL